MSESAWSNEAWVTTEASAGSTGGEWAGLTPNKFVRNVDELRAIMNTAVAGDTVGVYAGLYVGTNPKPDYGAQDEGIRFYAAFAPANNGSAGNEITFVAQWPAAQHTTNSQYTELRSGSDGKDPDTGGVYNWQGQHNSEYGWPVLGSNWWQGGDYVHYIGFYINGKEANNSIYDDCGYVNIRGADYAKVLQCKIEGDNNRIYLGNNFSCVRIEESTHIEVADCDLSDCGHSPVTAGPNCAGVLTYESRDMNVHHNNISRCNHGIQHKRGYVDTQISGLNDYNHIDGCFHAWRLHSFGGDDNEPRSSISHNLITDTNLFFELTLSGGGRGVFNIDFHHNTLSGGDNKRDAASYFFQYWTSGEDPRGNSWKNSILSQLGAYMGSYNKTIQEMSDAGEWAYNCAHVPDYIWKPIATTLSAFQSTYSNELNTIESDPLFVDAAGGDYRLQTGSPCRTGSDTGGPQGCYITGNETIGIR